MKREARGFLQSSRPSLFRLMALCCLAAWSLGVGAQTEANQLIHITSAEMMVETRPFSPPGSTINLIRKILQLVEAKMQNVDRRWQQPIKVAMRSSQDGSAG